ncbi:phosphoribosylpyrophosphate synthetase [Solitalea sp. MAHUQ-68]|uniref:Phosphoribosylpyrophosphate synthetase n=1 Tax=Solitalea agri TaxID=2953739 RepID=A0A9X2JC22_9SPHI|nr:phosphoribosylpyrophosphate synthetase [Solitalea agri]MCO4291310.1 phosphoribosylpyrophosphate synthetase [Solitalea agri]
MYSYDSLMEALDGLKERGFNLNFNLKNDHLACEEHDLFWHPEHFEIVEVYRFEGMTDPDEQAAVYAIQSDEGQKGVFVSAYGIYMDAVSEELLKKLTMHTH